MAREKSSAPARGHGRGVAPLVHPAASLTFDGVRKTFPGRDTPVLEDFSLHVGAGEVCVLLGPSGGGKTTALRMVNRLIEFDAGDIRIDTESIRSVPPIELRRRIGYVIQQAGLFPHMSVTGNIAVVPRLLKWDDKRVQQRVDELLDLVGLTQSEGARFPAALSGGQKQRVGLARALAADPAIMLMDEPFGALDPITRLRMQDEFIRLHRQVTKTVILVTHDVDEAMKMGDKIAILGVGGKLVQYGTPDEILAEPEPTFVASFIGGDRALRRLALRTVADVELELDDDTSPERGSLGDAAVVNGDRSLRDALSLMLELGTDTLRVERDGRSVGLLTRAAIDASLGALLPVDARVPE